MTIVIQTTLTNRLPMIPVVLTVRVPAVTLTPTQNIPCVRLLPNENPCICRKQKEQHCRLTTCHIKFLYTRLIFICLQHSRSVESSVLKFHLSYMNKEPYKEAYNALMNP